MDPINIAERGMILITRGHEAFISTEWGWRERRKHLQVQIEPQDAWKLQKVLAACLNACGKYMCWSLRMNITMLQRLTCFVLASTQGFQMPWGGVIFTKYHHYNKYHLLSSFWKICLFYVMRVLGCISKARCVLQCDMLYFI